MNAGTFVFPRPKPGRHAPYPWAKLTEIGSFFFVRTEHSAKYYSSEKGNFARGAIRSAASQYRRAHDPSARFKIMWLSVEKRPAVILLVKRVA